LKVALNTIKPNQTYFVAHLFLDHLDKGQVILFCHLMISILIQMMYVKSSTKIPHLILFGVKT